MGGDWAQELLRRKKGFLSSCLNFEFWNLFFPVEEAIAV
jgi:hypothetical protein